MTASASLASAVLLTSYKAEYIHIINMVYFYMSHEDQHAKTFGVFRSVYSDIIHMITMSIK